MKRKWWTAIANSLEAIDAGAYEVRPAKTRRQAEGRASVAVKHGAAVAYAVKHGRSFFCARAPGVITKFNGLKSIEWTPLGSITFVPGMPKT